MRSRESHGRTLRLVFLEAFLIVFGVVVAYGVTRWSDGNQARRAAVLKTREYHARGVIADLPYEEVLALARIYHDQDRYEGQLDVVGSVILNRG